MKSIANSFTYLVSSIAFIRLLPVSALFYFGWITPLNSQRPQPVPPSRTVSGVTRDGCLVVPLIPSGTFVSKTSLAKPVVWFYVEYPQNGTIPDVEVSRKDINDKTISRHLKLDKLNPTFVSYALPIGQQELNENQTFRFKVKCNGDGNSIGINIKRVSTSELGSLSIIATPSLRYATELYKLDFWTESSNMILGASSSSLCKDKVNTVNLFTAKVTKLIGELDRDKKIKDNMRLTFQKHFENVCK